MNLEQAKVIIAKAIQEQAMELDLSSDNSASADACAGKLHDADLIELLPDLLQLNSLNTLKLCMNHLNDASYLKELRWLTTLDICGNRLENVSFLRELKSLTVLRLSLNQISDASAIKELRSLTALDLGNNKISDVTFLEELKSLTTLELGNNEITDASPIKELKYLSSLDLRSNKISDVSFLEELTSLTSLDLASNEIDQLSPLRELKSLTVLDLWNNKITDGSILKELTMLTSLTLGLNEVKGLSFLEDLTSLTSLGIDLLQIEDARFLEKLTALTALDLRCRAIENVSFLKGFTSLTSLALSGYNISDVSFLTELKSLTSLDMDLARINDFSFLLDLTNLTSLKLMLGFHRPFDASFLKALISLNSLELKFGQLSDVSFLKELKNLTSLNIDNNEITDISFVRELPSLTSLSIWGNPLPDLPKHLKEKALSLDRNEIDEIIRYYEQLEEGKDHIYEAKVLIVGEPGAGKTTLFRKLQNHEYLPQKATEQEKESTIGIDIAILEFPFDEERSFRAHLWDFGGQERQYVLHQYFFTEHSLYLLVADDRKELSNFNYWFEVIATLGRGCPVLVVLNEIHSKVTNFDISVYKREFGERVRDIDEKSVNFAFNADGRFVNLAAEIKTKLRNLDHIGQALPRTWVKIRKELGESDKPIISIDDYYEICAKNGARKPEYQRQILEYLHDLGIALNYKYDDNLRNKLILKPNWVIDALYVVLKNEKINANAGKFSSDEIFDLWCAYKAEERTILLQLMQKGKFEVAYRLAGKNEYIAPILLPEIAPKYDFDGTDGLQIHFDYRFKPKGIISRLIVRLHENIVSQNENQIAWKRGVLLKYENSTARIIESEQFRKITIAVSGTNPVENREWITVISNEIKRIHRDWFEDRLEYKELIPCYCEVCKKVDEPQFYELKTVKNYYKANIELNCDKSVNARRPQRVSARRLLEGIYIEDNTIENRSFDRREFHIANLNITHVSGDANRVFQGLNNTQITMQEQLIDEVSEKMNDTQKQSIEILVDEIILRIEKALLIFGRENDALTEAKKGTWEAKLKLALPFIPFELSRTITPDEFISRVRKWAYGDDLQLNILQSQ